MDRPGRRAPARWPASSRCGSRPRSGCGSSERTRRSERHRRRGAQPPPDDDRSVTELVFDVSERVSTLVREEIALAKAEISEKLSSILRGGAVGIAAGVFAFLGLILLMHAFAWLLVDLFFEDSIWVGFAIEAVIFFVIARPRRLLRVRALQKGAPPVPDDGDRGGQADPPDA